MIGSKDQFLADIMRSFGQRVAAGWANIFRSGSTPVEMLDAMTWTWTNINTLYHFPDEFKIQLAWLRQAPPDAIEPGWSFSEQLGRLSTLLAEGIAIGEIRPGICPTDLLARCVITVQWIPENILGTVSPHATWQKRCCERPRPGKEPVSRLERVGSRTARRDRLAA
jgi:hypothetical protein